MNYIKLPTDYSINSNFNLKQLYVSYPMCP